MNWMGPALFSTFSKREKISIIPPVLVLLILALTLPSPMKEVRIGGEVYRKMVMGGYIVPEWLFLLVVVPPTCLAWWGCWLLYGKIWPEPPVEETQEETFAYEKAFPMANGGMIYWKPDVPGTPSALEYEPPTFSDATTALEYLTESGPDPMRVMVVGDAWGQEYAEFQEARDDWLMQAPEATLRDLLPAAEGIFARGDPALDVTWALMRAVEMRGIPSRDEIQSLADRVPHEDVAKTLRGEPVEP